MVRTYTEPQQGNEPHAEVCASKIPLTKAQHCIALNWTVEICFEATKGEVGLNNYEVRSWTGWHCHITLAIPIHACLAVLRKTAAGEKSGTPTAIALALRLELLPYTMPELRRLLWPLLWARPPSPEHVRKFRP